MPPRNGRQERRRQRPIDAVLNPQLPALPQTTGTVTSPGTITGPVSPIDEVLGGGEVTTGEENPWVNPFMEVYEKTKTGAMANLADIQKQMSESFAHRGGYFGGKHAISQANVATKTGTFLDQLLAETELGASERQYEDWKFAEGQKMNLMNLLPLLLGTNTFENLVPMLGQGKGGAAGSAAGGLLGSFLGPVGTAAGTAAGSALF